MKRDITKTALITGITGQDGAYLAELLLAKGYIVHGVKRRASTFNTQRINHLYKDRHEKDARLFLHYGDLSDSTNIIRIIQETQPDEIYNLGAMSHVHVSFDMPEYSANVDGIGALRVLEAMRLLGLTDKTKFYQASTSELFGKAQETSQSEKTPFYPRSPYAAAKMYAYWITTNYREAYNMFACNGILFNHESPIRGETFVTRKITRAIARIALNLEDRLYLGNLNAMRDWGHAKDYVEAMYLMLQQPIPEDYVIATGESRSVREFVECVFNKIGIQIEFIGSGIEENGVITAIDKEYFSSKVKYTAEHLKIGKTVLTVAAEYFRPTEVDSLLGDASKAREKLGWQPKYSFDDLVSDMIDSDLALLQKSKLLRDHGHEMLSEHMYYD